MSGSRGTRIVVLEDDPSTRIFLADNLAADGYEPLPADCARDGLRLLASKAPDLLLLDLGLPDHDGLRVLAEVRAADGLAASVDPALPVVVLSGRAGELDRVRGLERGADDYVLKPFSYPELRLRVAGVLRRAGARDAVGPLRAGPLRIDPMARLVTIDGRAVALAGKEYALLLALATAPTRVFTKEELLRDVWGFRARGSTRTLDSHACRLRGKLAAHGLRAVVNVWGVGYRLVDGPAGEPRPPFEPLGELVE